MSVKMRSSSAAIAVLIFGICWGGHASALAQGLTDNANSILVDARTEILCKSMVQYIQKESATITVLNRDGLNAALFVCPCDGFSSLESFAGEIFDKDGKPIRKIKKSELQKSEYSSSLMTDDYRYYYECNYPSFPFTVKYTWTIKCNNGLISYPSFFPQRMFNQWVERSSYRIELPAGQSCRYHALNIQGKDISVNETTTPQGGRVIEAVAFKLPPIPKEPFAPAYTMLLPNIYFAPSAFRYDKTEGDMSTWQQYGAWQYKLLEGGGFLDEAFRLQLHKLVSECSTDREKVKAVYDYLAKTTRYVSIQLGIGGLQPIAASDVCRMGFGDCKGLSNYMGAMLKELGIPSTYTVISTDNERLISDFSSVNQMNHVILQVPLPQDTLWLECTNPQLPFGYIHQQIAGHDALLIEPTGGRLCRLPDYPDSLNTRHAMAKITLSPSASARMEVSETSRLFEYESESDIVYQKPDQQKDRVRSHISLPQADVSDLKIEERKETIPSITFAYRADTDQYGHRTGNRLFIPANVFRKGLDVPHLQNRICPVHLDYGFSDTDSIRIQLPEGYTIEALPQAAVLESPYGQFRSSVSVQERELLIVHHLRVLKGTYAPEEYAPFFEFCRQVSNQYNGKVVLRK